MKQKAQFIKLYIHGSMENRPKPSAPENIKVTSVVISGIRARREFG
jgi:hypothetical protein